MGTTAQKLQAILGSKADIKDAIEQKGVEVGSTPLSGYAQKILDIPSGGGGEDEPYTDDAVRFFDYDGKQLLGMSKEDFLALDAMPANPATHEELVFTEWSHTLAEVKNYVSKYNYCDVMALYDTVDGKTRVTIRVDAGDEITTNVGGWPCEVVIDWGDGQEDTVTGSANTIYATHIYTNAGDYTIVYNVKSGYIGRDHTLFGYTGNTFPIYLCNKVVSLHYGRSNGGRTYMLKGLNLEKATGYQLISPDSIEGGYPVKLKALFIRNKWYEALYLGTSIRCVVFKEGIANISSRILYFCNNVDRILLPSGQTSVVADLADYCCSAQVIVVPDGVTAINKYAFRYCYKVKSIYLPEGLLTIGDMVFAMCYTLKDMTIPSTVTSIGGQCFHNCIMLKDLYMKPTTPPTINSNTFSGFPTDSFTIHVPQGTLETYQGTTNWSSLAQYMVDDITE